MKNRINEITRILVPVDLLSSTEILIEFAIMISRKIGAHLTILHAFEHVEYRSECYDSGGIKMEKRLPVDCEIKMNAIIEKYKILFSDIDAVVVHGDPVECIIRFAEIESIDMIIIGTHSYRGLKKIILGSVANMIVKKLNCPILLFNPYIED